MLTTRPNSSRQELKALPVLFYSLVMGVLIFAAMGVAINKIQGPFLRDSFMEMILLIAAGVMAIICLPLALTLYRQRLNKDLRPDTPVDVKLDRYRGALILYLAICEGVGLFSVVCFLLTGNMIFLGICLLMVAAMFYKRPDKTRIFNDLHLDSKEQMELF